MSKEKHLQYLHQVINPILEKLVLDIMLAKPHDPINFMINWLIRSKQIEEENKSEIQVKGKSLRDVLKQTYQKQQTLKSSTNILEGEVIEESLNSTQIFLQRFKASQLLKSDKTLEQIERIHKQFKKALMFNNLDEIQINILINAMKQKKYKAGQFIIKQFEWEDEFYIVEKGELECFKVSKKDGPKIYLKRYTAGESFGQLSLLYNVPRQASIVCKTDTVLWSLNRETFINIIRDSALEKRTKYKTFIEEIQMLSKLDPYQKNKLADYFKEVTLKPAESFSRIQTSYPDCVYFVFEGEISVTKNKNGRSYELIRLQKGDYFGAIKKMKKLFQITLMVSVKTSKILCLDKQAFNYLIGQQNNQIQKKIIDYENQKK